MKKIILLISVFSLVSVMLRAELIGLLNTEKGLIRIKLYPEVAPLTVKRITELANSGFYNGIKFHRVVENFVIQAGDPTGTGEGGSGVSIAAEFSNLHYLTGSVGMARSADPDSNDSQFFICLSDQPHLDGRYTLFGQVTEGFEVLFLIRQNDRIISFKVMESESE